MHELGASRARTGEPATTIPDVRPLTRANRLRRNVPGVSLAVLVAAVATALGDLAPLVGGPVFGIVLGITLITAVPRLRRARWQPGLAVASRPVLQASIVLLGTGLSLQQVAKVGAESLPVMLGTLAVAFGGAWLFGRLLGVRGETQTLIGIGTGICGASAIAAATAVTGARRENVAYALGTIFTFNIAAVLLFPLIGQLLGLGQEAFGLWAGTAINDTSSVVAAGYAYGQDAGDYSIMVKLTRALMLVPVVITLAVLRARREATEQDHLAAASWHKIVPPFLLGFVAASALQSLGLIPSGWHPALSWLGTFLITTALAGIGMSMRLSDMRRAGLRPLLLGGFLWISVAASSLGIQALTGHFTG